MSGGRELGPIHQPGMFNIEAQRLGRRNGRWNGGMNRSTREEAIAAAKSWHADDGHRYRVFDLAGDVIFDTDGAALNEPSGTSGQLAVQIADQSVRSDIECYAQYLRVDGRTVYDTSRLVDGPKPDPATEAADLATIQRALRYIEQRGDALPFELHRSINDFNLVWFEDRPAPQPLTDAQRMDSEYAQAADRG